MIIHEHPHQIDIAYGGEIKVVSFGDIHWGARDCAEERFERSVLKRWEKDPTAYFVGTGDIFDAIIPSDTKRFRGSTNKDHRDADGRSVKEAVLDAAIEEFAELWEKYRIPKTRLLGMVSGNHHDNILRRCGTDLTARLCKRLGTKYLGYSAFVKMNIVRNKTSRIPLIGYVHHGFGGGTRTDGGSITKYCRHALRYQGAHFYAYGHDHQKWTKRLSIVEPSWVQKAVRDRSIVVASCGSFKRTVSNDEYPSYSEVAGYPPAEMGCVVFTARHTQRDDKRKRFEYLEISASE